MVFNAQGCQLHANFFRKKSFYLCLFIYWILKFHDTGCRIMQDTVSSQPEKQEFFFIAFVCHHYGIQMMFSKPKVRCKVCCNSGTWGPCVLYVWSVLSLLFSFPMTCHYFKTFLIKPQCTCKTKIFDKGQRALSFVGSVPKILQQSLQMLITLQLSVLKQCLFINNENFFSCVSLQYSGSCCANMLLHVFIVYKPCHLCIRRK